MSTIRIEYDYVKSEAAKINDNATKIETLLNGLIDSIQEDINASTWTGTASESFKSLWNKSADEFTDFIQYMKSVQSKVETAAKEAEFYDNALNG